MTRIRDHSQVDFRTENVTATFFTNPPPLPNKMSNLVFDLALYIKINHPAYWRTPPKPAAISISSTNDDPSLELLYLRRRARDRKKLTNQHWVIRIEIEGCKQDLKKNKFDFLLTIKGLLKGWGIKYAKPCKEVLV